jgi:hypothetical protein
VEGSPAAGGALAVPAGDLFHPERGPDPEGAGGAHTRHEPRAASGQLRAPGTRNLKLISQPGNECRQIRLYGSALHGKRVLCGEPGVIGGKPRELFIAEYERGACRVLNDATVPGSGRRSPGQGHRSRPRALPGHPRLAFFVTKPGGRTRASASSPGPRRPRRPIPPLKNDAPPRAGGSGARARGVAEERRQTDREDRRHGDSTGGTPRDPADEPRPTRSSQKMSTSTPGE